MLSVKLSARVISLVSRLNLRASSEAVTCCGIFDSPSLFQHQRAEPTIFALIVLYVMRWGLGHAFVRVHHIRVHHGTCSEEREAARAVKDIRYEQK